MSEEDIDWHATELAKTNPGVAPPELPGSRSAAGEVVATREAPELIEISTVRVLDELGVPAPEDADTRRAASQATPHRGRLWLLAFALLGLALLAWALI